MTLGTSSTEIYHGTGFIDHIDGFQCYWFGFKNRTINYTCGQHLVEDTTKTRTEIIDDANRYAVCTTLNDRMTPIDTLDGFASSITLTYLLNRHNWPHTDNLITTMHGGHTQTNDRTSLEDTRASRGILYFDFTNSNLIT